MNPARHESSDFGSLVLESVCFEFMKPHPDGPRWVVVLSPQGLCRVLSPGTQGVWANECISHEKNKAKKLFASNNLLSA